MPLLAADPRQRRIAILAESLFLANLLLAPGLAFAALIWLWLRQRHQADALARCHLRQTLWVSVWGGALLLLANGAILVLGGWQEPWAWMLVILYFTCVHSTLVLMGIVGLAKAMAGEPWVYPVIGRGPHD